LLHDVAQGRARLSREALTHLLGCDACRAVVVAAVSDEGPTVSVGGAVARTQVPALDEGGRVGRFLLLSELGRGGMGRVFAAYDPQLDRKVALKVLLADRGGGHDQARLQREAQALARVSHPNIVSVFDVDVYEGCVYIAMEYLAGQTLRAWLKERERPLAERLEVLRQAGEGLAVAHRAGLVHRDLKPANVMVGADGRVKVLDFGLARVGASVDQASGTSSDLPHAVAEEALTEPGHVSGTPGYVAPEHLFGAPATAQSDQFAFGVMLVQALSGERPFAGRTLVEYERSLRETPVDRVLEGRAPAWLSAIARRCLRHDPRERFPSMEAVLAALAADPARRRRRLGRSLAVVGLMVAVALGATRAARPSCPTQAEVLARAWSPETRSALGAHLQGLAPDRPEGTAAVLGQFDLLFGRWAQAVPLACQALQARPQGSEELGRVACLEREERRLSALERALLEGDAVVAGAADEFIRGSFQLPCADAQALARRVSDDVSPEREPLARELRAQLLFGSIDLTVGRAARALERARGVTARAAEAGLPGFESEGLFLSANALVEASLSRALTAGIDALAVQVASSRAVSRYNARGHPDDVRRLASLAEALWHRLGDDPRLEFEVCAALRVAALAQGDLQEAVALQRRQLAVVSRIWGETDSVALSVLQGLAERLQEAGDLGEAIELYQRLLTLLQRVPRASWGQRVDVSTDLAEALCAAGRRAEARAQLAEVLAQRPPDAPLSEDFAWGLELEQCNVWLVDDPARAVRHCEAALQQAGDSDGARGEALLLSARALTAAGRPKEGQRACEEAAPLLSQQQDTTGALALELEACRARAAEALGETTKVREGWSRAAARVGRWTPAAARAETSLHLAQALWATPVDRPHARALALAAAQALEGLPGLAPQRDEALAWLRDHP
jgi:tetratricopeptide (TPR) repeat protein/predicted Ser/Thr protein kinase